MKQKQENIQNLQNQENQIAKQQNQENNGVILNFQERRMLLDDKVRSYILRGRSKKSCLKFIKELGEKLGYENTDSHCLNIYYKVYSEIKLDMQEIKDELYTELTSKMFYLYEKNMDNKNYKECRECLLALMKLGGFGNNQVEINKPDEKIIISFND